MFGLVCGLVSSQTPDLYACKPHGLAVGTWPSAQVLAPMTPATSLTSLFCSPADGRRIALRGTENGALTAEIGAKVPEKRFLCQAPMATQVYP